MKATATHAQMTGLIIFIFFGVLAGWVLGGVGAVSAQVGLVYLGLAVTAAASLMLGVLLAVRAIVDADHYEIGTAQDNGA